MSDGERRPRVATSAAAGTEEVVLLLKDPGRRQALIKALARYVYEERREAARIGRMRQVKR